jgi:hypothetical protein
MNVRGGEALRLAFGLIGDGADDPEVSALTGLTEDAVQALRSDAFALLHDLLSDLRTADGADIWATARLSAKGVRRGVR